MDLSSVSSRRPSTHSFIEHGQLHPTFLDVVVVRANGLVPMDSNDRSDPYVIVDLCTTDSPSTAKPPGMKKNLSTMKRPSQSVLFSMKELPKTAVRPKTLDPVWNELIVLPVPATASDLKLCFTVMDHDIVGANDFQGYADYTLTPDDLCTTIAREISTSLQLCPRDGNNTDKALYFKKGKKLGTLDVRIRGRAGHDWGKLVSSHKHLRVEGISITVKRGEHLRLAEKAGTPTVVKMQTTGALQDEVLASGVSRNVLNPVWGDVFKTRVKQGTALEMMFIVASKDGAKFAGCTRLRLDPAMLQKSVGGPIEKSLRLGPRLDNDEDQANYYHFDEKIGFITITYRAWGVLVEKSPALTALTPGGRTGTDPLPVDRSPLVITSAAPSVVPDLSDRAFIHNSKRTPSHSALSQVERISSKGSSKSMLSQSEWQQPPMSTPVTRASRASWQAKDTEFASMQQWNDLRERPSPARGPVPSPMRKSPPRQPPAQGQPTRRKRTPPQDRMRGVHTPAQEMPQERTPVSIASDSPCTKSRWLPADEAAISFKATPTRDEEPGKIAGMRPIPRTEPAAAHINDQLLSEVSQLTKALRTQNEMQQSIMNLMTDLSPPRDRLAGRRIEPSSHDTLRELHSPTTPGGQHMTIHVDKASGMYYTHDPATGKSEWLVQDDSEGSETDSEGTYVEGTPLSQLL